MTTIIYAHPYNKSFNHAILDTVKERLDASGKDYTVLDLYADGFNPAFEADSLRLYSRGETADPLVAKYLDVLLGTDELIMIFPVWWGTVPAIVKGFFDKVFLPGKAYGYDAAGNLIPAQIKIDRTVVLTTSQADKQYFQPYFEGYLVPMTLSVVGMNNVEWHDCDQAAKGPDAVRTAFLEKVRTLF